MRVNKMKKMPLIIASLIASCSLFGYSNNNQKQDAQGTQDKVEQRKPYDQGHAVDKNQLLGAYNAPGRIDTTGAFDFFVEGSYLYWQPKEYGLDYAKYSYTNPTTDQGKIVHPNLNYKSAFNAALGFLTDFDNWGVLGRYHWFRSSDTSKFDRLTGTTLTSLLYYPQRGAENAVYVEFKWKLRLDMGDLEFFRGEYVGKNLTFRPHFGLRGGYSSQHMTSTTSLDSPYTQIIQDKGKQSGWFIGPRMGVDTDWLLGAGFRMFLNTALALPWQKFNVLYQQDDGIIIENLYTNIDETRYAVTPYFEINPGLAYGVYFWSNRMHLDISAGYSFHYWSSQNQIRALIDARNARSGENPGALMFQGLTASLRLDF